MQTDSDGPRVGVIPVSLRGCFLAPDCLAQLTSCAPG